MDNKDLKKQLAEKIKEMDAIDNQLNPLWAKKMDVVREIQELEQALKKLKEECKNGKSS